MTITLYLGGSLFTQEGYLLHYRELEVGDKKPEAIKLSYHLKDSPDDPDIAETKPSTPSKFELIFRPNDSGLYVCYL